MCHEKNSLSFLVIFLLFRFCISIDTIGPNQLLKDGEILISKGEKFELGFFRPHNSSRRYVGIWYHKVSEQTIVWVANRDNPINDTSGILSVDRNGNLVLFHSQEAKVPVWSTNITTTAVFPNYSAQLLESGNLVVFHGDSNKVVAWQSFEFPTDTLLPTMKLGVDRRSGLDSFLTSWKSPEDPGRGDYYYKFDFNESVPQAFLYQGSKRYWRGGPWNGFRLSGIPQMPSNYIFNVSYVNNQDEVAVLYGMLNPSIISRMVLDGSAGVIERMTWHERDKNWVVFWSAPKEPCDYYAHCGVFGHCNPYNVGEFECNCLPGFEPKSKGDWYLRDGSAGCVRKRTGGQVCGKGDGFVKIAGVKVPDTSVAEIDMSLDFKSCEKLCLKNCSCTGYTTADIKVNKGCITWYGDLIDMREFSNAGQDFYIRVDAIELALYSKKSKRIHGPIKVVIVVLCVAAFLLILVLAYWLLMKKKRGTAERSHRNLLFSHNSNSQTSFERSSNGEEINGRRTTADVHLYSLSTVMAATDNFSFANKVGEGGFGSVHKGILHNGTEIAVKRLSNSSGQGVEEFRNEVTLIAKLQHRNLVRLLGYCIQKEEKMLIYEYLPNKGLNCFIFDKEKRSVLDWRKRFDIILGIARGMVYLHHDSILRIIHRDLKASNVLLDASMNPKISDFGMARIFGGDKIEESTKRVVGTYGYMSPEYAMEGHFSIKSDVFSFGVLLLEIVSGRKNNSYYQENTVNLIGHVWDLWREGKALEIVDSSLGESADLQDDEILRCIHIGLLCVQESPNFRPTMSEVAFMLSNETSLCAPSQPAFLFRHQNKHAVDSISTSAGAISVNDVTVSMVVAR